MGSPNTKISDPSGPIATGMSRSGSETVSEHLDVRFEILGYHFRCRIIVISTVILSVLCLSFVRQGRGFDPDLLAGLRDRLPLTQLDVGLVKLPDDLFRRASAFPSPNPPAPNAENTTFSLEFKLDQNPGSRPNRQDSLTLAGAVLGEGVT